MGVGSHSVCVCAAWTRARVPSAPCTGDRFYALYTAHVGAACGDKGCGPLRKFVLLPPGEDKEDLQVGERAVACAAR